MHTWIQKNGWRNYLLYTGNSEDTHESSSTQRESIIQERMGGNNKIHTYIITHEKGVTRKCLNITKRKQTNAGTKGRIQHTRIHNYTHTKKKSYLLQQGL